MSTANQIDDISIFDTNGQRIAKLRHWATMEPVMVDCYACGTQSLCTRVQVVDDASLFTAMVCAVCMGAA